MRFQRENLICQFLIVCFSLLVAYPSFAQKWVLVRHGHALSNERHVYNGSLEKSPQYPLTDLGKSQIAESGKELRDQYHYDDSKIDAIFVSPFKRTQETADILIDAVKVNRDKIVLDPLLMDVFVGDAEGKSQRQFPIAMNVALGHAFNGENREDVGLRMWLFLMGVRKRGFKKDLLIVSHETPLVQLQNLLFQLSHQKISADNLKLLNLFVFTPHLKKLLYHTFHPLSGPPTGQKNGEVKVIDFDVQLMGD